MNSKQKAEAIVKAAFQSGYVSQISRTDLRKVIAQTLCVIDERSLKQWEKGLEILGYATHQFNIFKWNYEELAKIPTLKQLTMEQAQNVNST